jgi:hypothetical protein
MHAAVGALPVDNSTAPAGGKSGSGKYNNNNNNNNKSGKSSKGHKAPLANPYIS